MNLSESIRRMKQRRVSLNLLLLWPTADGYHAKVSEVEKKRESVNIFLKAAGYLDWAVRHVLPHLPAELRRELPVDIAEGILRDLSLQALGQGVEKCILTGDSARKRPN